MARQGERAKHAYVEAVAVSGEELAAFCERWRIVELAFFGSVLRDDFGPHSDVDVLVRFHPEAKHSLMGLVTVQEELSRVLGREVDLHERTAVERSRNYIRRRAILEAAEVVYAA